MTTGDSNDDVMNDSQARTEAGRMDSSVESPTRIMNRWSLRLILYLGGLIVSAFVGVWINAQAEKAGLVVQVTSVTVRTPSEEQLMSDGIDQLLGGESRESVTAEAQLKRLSAEHSWIKSPDEGSRVDYMRSLLDIQSTANTLLARMKALRADLASWPSPDAGTQLDAVYRILREHGEVITSHILGETDRGVVIFAADKPNYELLSKRYELEVDDDGDFFVDSGKMRLPILWSMQRRGGAVVKTRRRDVAERLALALVYGVTQDLQDLKRSLDKMFQEEGSTIDILSLVERELQINSYWEATATIANNGKDTVALDPRTMLYLQTKDRYYLDREKKQHRLDTNLRVGMTLVSEGKRMLEIGSGISLEISSARVSSSPIMVRGGEAATVTFRSVAPIGQMPDGEQVLSLFKGDGCPCRLTVLPLTQSKLEFGPRRMVVSRDGTFREVKYDTLFAQELEAWPVSQ